MVRTKTRARTLEERYPNGPPDIKLRPAYRIVYNNRIFNDHTGRPALMSWERWRFEEPFGARSGVEDDSYQEPGHEATADSQLPGLVWPENDDEWKEFYHGWFFMYPHAGIECRSAEEKAREIYLVKFDPIPIPDWDEEVECKPSPMERPIVSRRMKAKSEEGFEDGLFGWMETRKMSLWEQAADEATDNALELGWESW
ncbi:hypothetical protein NW759_001860 [Fusarium solani]|nr:hypothetical protein NW759_001860 [Fusarium solani]